MRSRWLDICQILFLGEGVFMDQDEAKGDKHTKKKKANIQPSLIEQAWSIKN